MRMTITESQTSFAFQLARDAARSSATVVANVNPFNWAGDGFSVKRLTITIMAIETKNNIIQK